MSIEKKIGWRDLTGTGKELEWVYTGEHDLYMEGRIAGKSENSYRILLAGPWEQDIVSTNYDGEKKTYEIFVKAPEEGEIRAAILTSVPFSVPLETQKIAVYEWKNPRKNCWDPRTWGK
ncbi:hypothetical protein HY639_04275 [Candidatus Woesearchaeota archaeon]|nr:hypothetical protein [Candidatus Woesearchaeota archaeon]